MSLIASSHAKPLFLGQAVRYPGTAMHATLAHLPENIRLEFPVAENLQLGIATGLALAGHLPVAVFPRINFLLEAMSQLVQHLDKLPIYSDGRFNPRVLIRTSVAGNPEMDPGPQHLGDYVPSLLALLRNVYVVPLYRTADVVPAYRRALSVRGSTILVEYLELYDRGTAE